MNGIQVTKPAGRKWNRILPVSLFIDAKSMFILNESAYATGLYD